MANYKEEDFINAVRILNEVKVYVDERIGSYYYKANFPQDMKIVCLGVSNHPIHGNMEHYLSFQYDGLCVTKFAEDGTIFYETLDYTLIPRHSVYNNKPQITIDLALDIIKNWGKIKECVKSIENDYQKEALKSLVLATFKPD